MVVYGDKRIASRHGHQEFGICQIDSGAGVVRGRLVEDQKHEIVFFVVEEQMRQAAREALSLS